MDSESDRYILKRPKSVVGGDDAGVSKMSSIESIDPIMYHFFKRIPQYKVSRYFFFVQISKM